MQQTNFFTEPPIPEVRFFDELESRRIEARMNSPPNIDIRCSETIVSFYEFKISSNPLNYYSQEKIYLLRLRLFSYKNNI